MKKIAVIGLIFALSACGATPEQQASSMAAVQDKLPDGCELTYAGDVDVADSQYPSHIFFVKCGDVTTVSETHLVPNGKQTRPLTTVTVGQ